MNAHYVGDGKTCTPHRKPSYMFYFSLWPLWQTLISSLWKKLYPPIVMSPNNNSCLLKCRRIYYNTEISNALKARFCLFILLVASDFLGFFNFERISGWFFHWFFFKYVQLNWSRCQFLKIKQLWKYEFLTYFLYTRWPRWFRYFSERC